MKIGCANWRSITLVAAHLTATLVIASCYRRGASLDMASAVAGLFASQATLLAIWGSWGAGPLWIRGTTAALGVTFLWYLQCRALNISLSSDLAAAHAIMFAVQVALIAGCASAARFVIWLRQMAGNRDATRLQFTVGVLLASGAGIGIVLGIWKMVLGSSNWSPAVLKGEMVPFGIIVGTCNASYALLFAAAAASARKWPWMIAVPAVVVLACFQQQILQAFTVPSGMVSGRVWLVQALMQSLVVPATLVLGHGSGYNRDCSQHRCRASHG
jgi:hypothetical protein